LRSSGGGRLDGKAYLEHLGQRLAQKQMEQIQAKVTLHKKSDSWLIKGPFGEYTADRVILTPGPALKPLLQELGYAADIRPQKGQLLAFQTSYKMSQDWPVAMLDGEADFIPFMDGKILLGATHENDQGWDLAPTSEAYKGLTKSTEQFLTDPDQIKNWPYEFRVGTRAYTSDFSPFFGVLPDDPSLLAASGLGSSGLTTGPYIGYLLANFLNTGHWPTEDYQKDISTYITKNPS
ncbi:TPA: FAD-binding oxidoreductase, partial [Enterococcus faecium]|nr:FAD-binding oxidoreductase [Enterococcus faecium]